MKISEIYPTFVIDDEWGRKIEVRARQSLFVRKQLNTVTPQAVIGEEEPITRIQFALMLLLKIEELFGQEVMFNHDNPADNPGPATPGLDAHFGPRKKK